VACGRALEQDAEWRDAPCPGAARFRPEPVDSRSGRSATAYHL